MSIDALMTAGSVDFTCERHGHYSGLNLSKIKQHFCPGCLDQMDVMESQVASVYDAEQQAFDWWRNHSGVTWRHANRSLANYKPCSKAQEAAKNVVTAYADHMREQVRDGYGLIFLGPPGTGKTHLMQALISHGCRIRIRGRYIVWPEVLELIKASYSAGPEHRGRGLLDKLRHDQLLAIDELGVRAGSEHDQAALFDLIDFRYREGLPTLAASNATTEGFDVIGERTADRLRECAGIVHLPGTSQREHAANNPALRDDTPLVHPPEPRVVRGEVTCNGELQPYERVYPRPDPYARRAAA